jgi:anti-sigma B factor antagonist
VSPADEVKAGEPLTIEVEYAGRVPVVRLHGELDIVSAGSFRAALDELILDGGPVVVDLRELAFIDSAGLGALVRAHKKARVLQGSLVCVCVPDGQAASLFRLTGLHRVLRVSPTLEQALDPSTT